MAQFKSIIVPVDVAEPDTAGPAIERAADLAHASYGTIRLIYVRSILPVTSRCCSVSKFAGTNSM
jgi:hypothetical protein